MFSGQPMTYRLILFLVINLLALAVGSIFTSQGVPSDWYMHLSKAPWTPPGWSFGLAWGTIMICFSVYMAQLWPLVRNKQEMLVLFTLQWVLNVLWNPIFFWYHQVLLGAIIISLLTVLMGFFLIRYWSVLSLKSLLVLPYVIWLLIATSLNVYIYVRN